MSQEFSTACLELDIIELRYIKSIIIITSPNGEEKLLCTADDINDNVITMKHASSSYLTKAHHRLHVHYCCI